MRSTRQLQFLRPEQILAEQQRCPLVYLPLGPLEWHGPHLPLGVDPLNAENAACLAAEKTGGLVTPTLYWGTERERTPEVLDWMGLTPDQYVVGMDFATNSLPSAYAPEEMFALVVRELLNQMARLGFRMAVLVSGHGATNHLAVLDRLAAEFNAHGRLRVTVVLPFVTAADGVMHVGHASRIETAVTQALYAGTVKMDALPAQPQPLRSADYAVVDYAAFLGQPTPERTIRSDDDPRDATPQEGQQVILQAVDQIVQKVLLFIQINSSQEDSDV